MLRSSFKEWKSKKSQKYIRETVWTFAPQVHAEPHLTCCIPFRCPLQAGELSISATWLNRKSTNTNCNTLSLRVSACKHTVLTVFHTLASLSHIYYGERVKGHCLFRKWSLTGIGVLTHHSLRSPEHWASLLLNSGVNADFWIESFCQQFIKTPPTAPNTFIIGRLKGWNPKSLSPMDQVPQACLKEMWRCAFAGPLMTPLKSFSTYGVTSNDSCHQTEPVMRRFYGAAVALAGPEANNGSSVQQMVEFTPQSSCTNSLHFSMRLGLVQIALQ